MQCISPLSIKHSEGTTSADRRIVPCGECGACKYNRRIDWSFRLKEEARHALSGWFITMTYDPHSVPITNGIHTLAKRELQLLLKRLRKKHHAINTKSLSPFDKLPPIRYYAIGEYGEKSDRPHYHLMLFNAHLKTISKFDKIWSKGHIRMGAITPERIHYMTKYHVNTKKKSFLDEETGEIIPEKNIRQPEFALMSRRPGIGHQYIKRIKDWHFDSDKNYLINNGYKQRIPKYYKDRINMKPIDQDLIIKESDIAYHREMERLTNLKVQNPHTYAENARYQESLYVFKDAKSNRTI